MTDFESYTLDQFPLRDSFRTLKALFHNYVMQQKDNNGIYMAQGYAAEMEYPLEEGSVSHALQQFGKVYDKYLKDAGSTVICAVVPDKGYYLARENGYLELDYEKLFSMVRQGMPWATHVDLTGKLTLQDYYFTDTHWRQERLLPVAQLLSQSLGVKPPKAEDFTQTAVERPFYGVYHGQAALPMDAETLYLMENDTIRGCTVTGYDTMGRETVRKIYDEADLQAKDLYDIYLSGMEGLLVIDNPDAATDRELVIFRDSFGSSLAPLLLSDYSKVTLVDIRYISVDALSQFVDFHGQDVLFLYSTLVLNKNLI
ncbi:MAG: hypothetical protein J6A74_01355 [Oscillospiraceae bacterium]|nr:hypothetical protein [Oscillospiraceae bacterium]